MAANGMNINVHTIYLKDLTVFNTSVTADTDILSTDITIGDDNTIENQFDFTKGCSVTVEASFAAAGVFYFVIKDASNTEVKVKTLNGTDVAADAGLTVNITLIEGYKLNFRYSASTTLNWGSVTLHGGKMP